MQQGQTSTEAEQLKEKACNKVQEQYFMQEDDIQSKNEIKSCKIGTKAKIVYLII